MKAALDTKAIFTMILKRENIKNVLFVGPTAGADLVGCSNALDALDKELDVTILENVNGALDLIVLFQIVFILKMRLDFHFLP